MEASSKVVAALGPTNTGKTYRAVQRLLEHRSGMIGLPLRLLAREVYDTLTAKLGEAEVALVTGEEKRVPRAPRYWVCTVEAMPLGLEVDFVAIDEIQLAAHPERGHVFTDRMLHMRGREETWFLGSNSMASILGRAVPGLEFVSYPRLSELKSAGSYTLGSLPRRSAVVAFSAKRVYEIAGRLRARRGGAAIVLGALSPRARNAQVAMYQAGEVDYIVATDAIGMGLNLDVEQIAFADTEKFDGREQRALDLSELSQIAGRAGRYQKHGEFGVLAPAPPLTTSVVLALERHQIPSVPFVYYRNSDLDFTSVARLSDSLAKKAALPWQRLAVLPEDAVTLAKLSRTPEVMARATGPERVRLLWEVCQIPDYRQLLLDQHAKLCEEIYVRLVDDGRLSADYLERELRHLEKHHNDIESVTNRIAFARTFTYVTCRDSWIDDARGYHQRTLALEERLSDVLHELLVNTFVEKKKKARSVPEALEKVTPKNASPFAELAKLKAAMEAKTEPEGPNPLLRLPEALHTEFSLDGAGAITFLGRRVARLAPGRKVSEPEVKLDELELGAGFARQSQRRLTAFVRDWVSEFVGEARLLRVDEGAEEPSAALRGLAYQLREGLGTVLVDPALPLVDGLDVRELALLHKAGITLGQRVIYVRSLLRGEGRARRALLVRLFSGSPALRAEPSALRPAFRATAEVPPTHYLALGYVVSSGYAFRCDQFEEVVALLEAADDEMTREPLSGKIEFSERALSKIGSLCGCPKKEAQRIARAITPG